MTEKMHYSRHGLNVVKTKVKVRVLRAIEQADGGQFVFNATGGYSGERLEMYRIKEGGRVLSS